jgi:DNA-binding MarR family transcriptional regulator
MGARALPCEAWQLLFELLMATRASVPSVAAEFALSEPQCHVLRLLIPGELVAMGALAAALACDASNVTGIVDRLESRGLLARHSSPHDRRKRVIGLTPRGAEVRARLMERLAEPPDTIARLPVEDQRALCDILRRALGGRRAPTPTRGRRRRALA